jgi:NAD(P)H-dependent flavin oxidoreductase YrpB (nitropropane dioxygenase family)
MLPASGLSPALLAELLERLQRQTSRPIGTNFLVPFLDDPACVAIAAARSPLVEFFFGDPDGALVELVHAGGALAGWQVGSRQEAIAAAEAGCDLIVAQGVEAGGHVRGITPLRHLVGEVLEAVDVPVLATGGISSGQAMAAALEAGADGVRVGTRLLAAAEAGIHPVYRAALIASTAEDTVLTEAYAIGWPISAPHRVLRSSVEAAEAFQGEVVGEKSNPYTGEVAPVGRFEKVVPTDRTTGAITAMSLFAGESVGSVSCVQPATAIVRELSEEAERWLRRAVGPAA